MFHRSFFYVQYGRIFCIYAGSKRIACMYIMAVKKRKDKKKTMKKRLENG